MSTNAGEQILAHNDRKRIEVPCPEWPVTVWVYEMTIEEKERWYIELEKIKDGHLTTTLLVTLTACDETGAPLFTLDQAGRLKTKSSVVMERIGLAAMKLNALMKDSVGEAAKN